MKPALTRWQSDGGFSLVEWLVVMIIVGLLASIAVPLYVDQKKKGHDAATKSDVDAVADALVDYLADHTTLPAVVVDGREVTLGGEEIVTLSRGVVLHPVVGSLATDWCVDATHPGGDRAKTKGYKFSAGDKKVEEGRCA